MVVAAILQLSNKVLDSQSFVCCRDQRPHCNMDASASGSDTSRAPGSETPAPATDSIVTATILRPPVPSATAHPTPTCSSPTSSSAAGTVSAFQSMLDQSIQTAIASSMSRIMGAVDARIQAAIGSSATASGSTGPSPPTPAGTTTPSSGIYRQTSLEYPSLSPFSIPQNVTLHG